MRLLSLQPIHPVILNDRLLWLCASCIASDSAVDTVSRPPYNAPARLGSWLTLSLVAEQEPTYAAHASRTILSASGAAVPPRSGPFCGEAATPQSPLISSPAGEASPAFALILCLQRSYLLAQPASDAIVRQYTPVCRAMRLCLADGSCLGMARPAGR